MVGGWLCEGQLVVLEGNGGPEGQQVVFKGIGGLLKDSRWFFRGTVGGLGGVQWVACQ